MMTIKRILKREVIMWANEYYLFKGDIIRLKNYIGRKLGLRNKNKIDYYVRFHK